MSEVMPEVENATRTEVDDVVQKLKALRAHLLGLHDRLPVSPREDVMLLGEEEPDFPTEARATIECVLHDQLEPAIRDLGKLAKE